MVRDYAEQYYAPAAISGHAVTDNDFAGARELARFRALVDRSWPAVRVRHVDTAGLPDTPLLGSTMTIAAHVDLAGLGPDQVLVQAVVGRVDDEENLSQVVTSTMSPAPVSGQSGDSTIFEVAVPLPMTGPVGYTVRVMPSHELLTSNAELAKVTFAQ
jgi:starch phosphorylase